MSSLLNTDKEYFDWVKDVIVRYRRGQIKAAVKVNQELLSFYWDLGRDIVEMKADSKWGEGFYKNLSADLCAKLPDVKGFSETSLKYLKYFYSTYNQILIIRPQLVDELKASIFSIPWGHHRILLDKFRNNPEKALFFIRKTREQNWSRAVLLNFIDTDLYERSGKAVSNFTETLPATQSDLAQELTKDPYNFNFLTLDKKYNEKDLKDALVDNVSKFLIEMGKGFAYMGREYRLLVGATEQFLDLLFYNTIAHCYVVVEVKTSKFEASFLGQLSAYVSCANHLLKRDGDNPTIGQCFCAVLSGGLQPATGHLRV